MTAEVSASKYLWTLNQITQTVAHLKQETQTSGQVQALVVKHNRPRSLSFYAEEMKMPTTKDIVDQHLQSFFKKDLDTLLADYTPEAVLFIPGGALKDSATRKPFFRRSLPSLPSLARRFRCMSNP